MDSPDCLLLFLSIYVFYFRFFLVYTLFSCRFRAVDYAELTHVGFRAHVNIASRIVLYRKVQHFYEDVNLQ